MKKIKYEKKTYVQKSFLMTFSNKVNVDLYVLSTQKLFNNNSLYKRLALIHLVNLLYEEFSSLADNLTLQYCSYLHEENEIVRILGYASFKISQHTGNNHECHTFLKTEISLPIYIS